LLLKLFYPNGERESRGKYTFEYSCGKKEITKRQKKSPAGAGDGKKYLKMPLEVFWRGLALDERPIFERKRRGRRCVTTNCPRDGPAPASYKFRAYALTFAEP
jgi:hypothetical protein